MEKVHQYLPWILTKFNPSSNGTRCLLDLVNYLENQQLKLKINRPGYKKNKVSIWQTFLIFILIFLV